MDAKDPSIHQQLQYIADSGRQAVAADRAIFLVQMYDDVEKAEATMITFSVNKKNMRNEDAVLQAILMLKSAMNALVAAGDSKARIEVRLIAQDGESILLEEDLDVKYQMREVEK